jgi:hypothetical protein
MEFIFVVESEEDPAYTELHDLMQTSFTDTDVKITVAGLTWHSSQKIHNLLEARRSPLYCAVWGQRCG